MDIVFDDLENSMLVEEAVADANKIINEKLLRRKRISEEGKKRPLEDANVVVSAKCPRADQDRMQLDFFLFTDPMLFWNLYVYFQNC